MNSLPFSRVIPEPLLYLERLAVRVSGLLVALALPLGILPAQWQPGQLPTTPAPPLSLSQSQIPLVIRQNARQGDIPIAVVPRR